MADSDLFSLYEYTGLSSNMEDYMETISLLAEEKGAARVKDIAKRLDIKMPSVTSALNKLKALELIDYEKYGFVKLTEQGSILAAQVYNKHKCLTEFFKKVLMLDDSTADQEACRVEHALSPETCVQFHKLLTFIRNAESADSRWYTDMKSALK